MLDRSRTNLTSLSNILLLFCCNIVKLLGIIYNFEGFGDIVMRVKDLEDTSESALAKVLDRLESLLKFCEALCHRFIK